MEPSDVIAVRERQLMLDCRVQGEEPIMITWRRNGVPLATSPRVQVLTNGTLLIQSFQKRKDGNEGDIGEYDCAAQNRYGMLVSRKAKVLLACKYYNEDRNPLLSPQIQQNIAQSWYVSQVVVGVQSHDSGVRAASQAAHLPGNRMGGVSKDAVDSPETDVLPRRLQVNQ